MQLHSIDANLLTWNLIDPLSFIFRSRREKKKKRAVFIKTGLKKKRYTKPLIKLCLKKLSTHFLIRTFLHRKGVSVLNLLDKKRELTLVKVRIAYES